MASARDVTSVAWHLVSRLSSLTGAPLDSYWPGSQRWRGDTSIEARCAGTSERHHETVHRYWCSTRITDKCSFFPSAVCTRFCNSRIDGFQSVFGQKPMSIQQRTYIGGTQYAQLHSAPTHTGTRDYELARRWKRSRTNRGPVGQYSET